MSSGSVDTVVEAQLAAALASANATVQAAITQGQYSFNAAVQSSIIRANADVQAATITGTDHITATTSMSQAETTSANIRAQADIQVGILNNSTQVQVAQIQASYEVAVADHNHANDITVANIQGVNESKVATINHANDITVANTQAASDAFVATTRATADTAVANTNAIASKYNADQKLASDEYGSNLQFQGTEYTANMQLTVLNTKLAWAQEKWNLVWPFVESTFSSADGKIDPASAYAQMLATVGSPPSFAPTSVYTEQQIQQQLNVAYSRIWQSVSSKTRSAEIDLAGRGFSSSSPILNAIRQGYEGYGIMSTADEEVKIRLGAATANAEQVLKSQTEAIAYYEQNLAAYTALEKTLADLYTGMLSATAQLVSAGS